MPCPAGNRRWSLCRSLCRVIVFGGRDPPNWHVWILSSLITSTNHPARGVLHYILTCAQFQHVEKAPIPRGLKATDLILENIRSSFSDLLWTWAVLFQFCCQSHSSRCLALGSHPTEMDHKPGSWNSSISMHRSNYFDSWIILVWNLHTVCQTVGNWKSTPFYMLLTRMCSWGFFRICTIQSSNL